MNLEPLFYDIQEIEGRYTTSDIISKEIVMLYGMVYNRIETDTQIHWWRNGYLNIVMHKEGSYIPALGYKYFHTKAKQFLTKESDYIFYVSFEIDN